MSKMGSGEDFDRWLERELRGVVGQLRGTRPRAHEATYFAALAAGGQMTLSARLIATLTSRAAALAAAAALSVGGGAYALAAAATGDPNPLNWGQQVKQVVQQCKEEVRSESPVGEASEAREVSAARNVGQCVSAFARQHGQQERSQHSQGQNHGQGKQEHEQEADQAQGHAQGKGDSHGQGQGQGQGDSRGQGQGESHGQGQGQGQGQGRGSGGGHH